MILENQGAREGDCFAGVEYTRGGERNAELSFNGLLRFWTASASPTTSSRGRDELTVLRGTSNNNNQNDNKRKRGNAKYELQNAKRRRQKRERKNTQRLVWIGEGRKEQGRNISRGRRRKKKNPPFQPHVLSLRLFSPDRENPELLRLPTRSTLGQWVALPLERRAYYI